MSTQPPPSGPPGRTFQEHFTTLAGAYARSTGNSTYKIIFNYLSQADPPIITTSSIINDNASGPAIATAAIIAYLGGHEPARIEATDSNPTMVDAAQARIDGSGWRNVRASNQDSHALGFADETFTTSVSNINVSTYADPLACLKEMYRTLKPGGVAVVSMWKRFAAADLIHEAQRAVSAEDEPMKVPRAEFMREGYLEGFVRQAGFEEVRTEVVSALSEGEEVAGLREFMLGDFTKPVRAKWTEREQAEWPAAVERAVRNEVAKNGGIRFEAWVVTGRK